MLNRIKAFVKQVVELVEAHKTLRSSVLSATELVEGVHVFVSDEHCLCSAYLTKDVIGAFAGVNAFGIPVIVINNKCNDRRARNKKRSYFFQYTSQQTNEMFIAGCIFHNQRKTHYRTNRSN